MAGRQEPGTLSQRKQALLVESELNRLVMRVEFENLCAAASRIDETMTTARRLAPWLLPVASILGLFAARVFRKRSSALSLFPLLLRLAPTLVSLLRKPAAKD